MTNKTAKFRVLALMVLAAMMTAFMVSCGGADLSKATLKGYGDVPFEASIEKMIDEMSRWGQQEGVKMSVSHEWKDGWEGEDAPSTALLLSGEKAVTYVLSVTLSAGGESETNRLAFYFIHDTKANTLSVQGGIMTEDGYEYRMDIDEAEEMMVDLYEGEY